MRPENFAPANDQKEFTQVEDYNKHKFKEFLAYHHLEKLKDKLVILVLGPTGAGKSTAITIQLGGIYRKNLNWRPGNNQDRYVLERVEVDAPAVGGGFISKTLNIHAYEDPATQFLYVDTAGFGENRGKEEELWTKSNLDLLFSIIGGVKAVLVLVNYGAIFSDRANGFRNFAEDFFKATMSSEIFYDSMIFVITNAYSGGFTLSLADIKITFERLLKETREQEHLFILDLEKRYPRGVLAAGAALVGAMASGRGEEQVKFDMNKVPNADKMQLARYRSTCSLLEAILKASNEGRIVISEPDNPEACKALREEIVSLIRKRPLIPKGGLRELARTNIPSNRFLFQSLLSSMASDYLLNGLTEEALILDQLVESFQQKKQYLDAIEQDWQSVKRTFIIQKRNQLTSIKAMALTNRNEIYKLETSLAEVVLTEASILKACSVGFLAIKWLFRQAYVEEVYQYTGQPFLKYSLDFSVEKANVEILEYKPSEGKLKIKFTSKNGDDLNVKIKIIVREKDAPATHDRVKILKSQLETHTTEIESIEKYLVSLDAISSKQALEKAITQDNLDLQERLKTVVSEFEKPLRDDAKIEDAKLEQARERHVIRGLERFFRLLESTNVRHPELPQASVASIQDFLEDCKQIENAAKDPYVGRLLPEIVYSQKPTDLRSPETRPPVLNNISDYCKTFINDLTPTLYKIFLGESILFRKSELSVCTLLVWSLGISEIPLPVLGIALFITVCGVRDIFCEISSKTKAAIETNNRIILRELNSVIDQIQVEAQKTTMTAANLGELAVQQLTDKVKVNIDAKADVKLQFGGGVWSTLLGLIGFRR